ncbi:ABC transporter permease [Pedobacter insulae]|uniref:Putative ABC transport system permease protein n=1 Tax=Pedobacter insulae TaxID=414048 RepID=A0A1I2WK68_9SPHI|nr:FtsX-like permease family protein [Pedobacter insulae]SFH01703.1 putative ABC transport system permease protein [Pedobacter insulae]
MFKLNLKIALRNIWNHKLTTLIKLIGLIVGLSTVVLLVAYVMFELSFDQHNVNVNEIYRLHSINSKDQKEEINLPSGLAEMLRDEVPEVNKTTMLHSHEVQVKVGENFFKEHLATTENTFFDIFTVPLVIGDSKNLLKEANTLIISEGFAKTAFPKGNAVGQLITLANYPNAYQVVGVMKDLPKASHFRADLITRTGLSKKLNWSGYSSIPQYIQLKKGVSPLVVEQRLKALYGKYKFPKTVKINLMPLSKIHLYSHTGSEMEANSDIKYIYIFSVVAFFILLIAIVNFINLTIAASIKRGKEIGVKKVMGASPRQLRVQFLSESYLYFILAALLALILTHDLIPYLGGKLGVEVSLSGMVNLKTALISLGIIVFAGFVAGLYPAIILSRLMPVKTLKGYTGHTSGKFGFKNILMIFQFCISAFLIICTLAIYTQLNFIRDKNLGFDKEQILVSSFTMFGENYANFKEELQRKADIKSLSLSSFNIGKSFGGSSSWTNDNDTTEYKSDHVYADLNFINTLNIQVVKGRAFSDKFGADMVDYDNVMGTVSSYEAYQKIIAQKPILLNEAAVKALNLTHPVDTVLNFGGLQGKVIGVVADFNGMSLHHKVNPLAINLSLNGMAGYLFVKTNSVNLSSTKAMIEELWKKYFPTIPSELTFLDTHLEQLYQSEMRLGSLFITFAGIAIFLCCIGLFGMVFFEVQQRTKEIAVRKVLGASIRDLLGLLNSSFIKLVILANLLIWPASYYLIREWLNGFYYRADLSYIPFVGALGISLVLTLVTVSLQAIKTIRKSPVKALKYE